jgi:hypothetical protein
MLPVLAPAVRGTDLSRYRNFQFGESLPTLAREAGLDVSEVKLIHEHPAVIQELEWPIWLGAGSAPQPDPVKTLLFSFCSGELFRIVVTYDRDGTQGLTANDMVEAISAKYGPATSLGATKTALASTQVDYESDTIIARWEDSQYSFVLSRSAIEAAYEMTACAKKVDALARAATAQANQFDAQMAPQREIERQQGEDAKNREALEKARQANKRNFQL